jgi:DNA modification methylase
MAEKITWTNGTRKLSELIPWDHNPRVINKREAERLEESLGEFGQVETIAIEPDNMIVDGHQRELVWKASQKYGPEYAVDVRVSSRKLTTKERQKLIVFLHKGATGHFDFDMLANEFEFEELISWGFDESELTGLDFGAEDEPKEDPGAQVDRAEELREKWQVNVGDMFSCGDHRIICGDCTDPSVVEKLMQGEHADILLTDPPYGKLKIFDSGKHVGKDHLAKVQSYGNHYQGEGDFKLQPVLDVVSAYTDLWVIWGGNYFTDILPPRTSWLIWDKRAGDHSWYSEFEMAWSNLPTVAKIFSFKWQGMIREGEREERYHPTQKPPELMEWILNDLAKEAQIVLEMFSGSGSTLIACEKTGRKCRAVEISPAYVSVALERFYQMTNIMPVLVEG